MRPPPPPTGIDAALFSTAQGHLLGHNEQLWLAQQASKLHAAVCMARLTLQDCAKLLGALEAEPEALAELAKVLTILDTVAVEAEGRTV